MTLFRLAAQYLGDATQWSRIAVINDLDDPFIQQVSSVMIPAVAGKAR